MDEVNLGLSYFDVSANHSKLFFGAIGVHLEVVNVNIFREHRKSKIRSIESSNKLCLASV